MSKFGWDLPPGCRTSDIPGNRPEDMIAEAQADAVYEIFPDCSDEQMEKMFLLLAKTYEDGINDGINSLREALEWAKHKPQE